MSRWLQLVSEMKRRSPDRYLTATQEQAFDQLCEALRFPNRINLYGPCGSGKTYVAWALASAVGAVHVALPELVGELESGHDCIIVDNVFHHEDSVRRVLAQTDLLGASSTVLITQAPVDVTMRRVELPLPTAEDVAKVLQSYWRLGYYQQHDLPAQPNFWQLLLACV